MEQTPVKRRTDAAIAKRRRNHEERLAAELRERGWIVMPPESTIHEQQEEGQ